MPKTICLPYLEHIIKHAMVKASLRHHRESDNTITTTTTKKQKNRKHRMARLRVRQNKIIESPHQTDSSTSRQVRRFMNQMDYYQFWKNCTQSEYIRKLKHAIYSYRAMHEVRPIIFTKINT